MVPVPMIFIWRFRMISFLTGALGLFDSTVRAMMAEPLMVFFLVFLLLVAVTVLFVSLASLSNSLHRR